MRLKAEALRIVEGIFAELAPSIKVLVFGSYVSGKATRRSDLDLLLRGDGLSKDGLMGDLKDAFGQSDLPFLVDLVDASFCDERFLSRVEPTAIPLSQLLLALPA